MTALDDDRRAYARQELFAAADAAAIINEVCAYCHPRGVGIVLENMLPHLFVGNIRPLLRIIGAIDGPCVGTCPDADHAFIAG